MGYVAAYQALYVGETLSKVEVSAEEHASQLTNLGQILERDLPGAHSAGGDIDVRNYWDTKVVL